jgi:predicted nucleic acid-binding Zn ribbon protein
MAIYPYKCPECGLEIERIQSSSTATAPKCERDLREDEECGGESPTKFKRIIGKPAAHFKGDDFYVNEDEDATNPASN